ncbi:LLM class flavin-dependent oxidoreductase [Pseudogracilibacillus sp. SO30301A]|uniref:LLM class flavin-dependent oxidoreductase n=1 Tax=Pseudogracilibacillus sp. SO30301A TaxID=3098291 RepID=UPI00300E05CF
MANIHIPVSVLDLGPLRKGESIKQAIDSMVNLAQATEEMGYTRYWISEHHNTASLISSATSILIKHILEHTEKIRVGAGGIMLPNHAPLVVAEQFGTMANIYPNRLDLGLGRAPGTDMLTASALRRSHNEDSVYSFPKDIQELLQYFGSAKDQGHVKANVAINTNVPLYILGSSPNSAYLAAELGLPYLFASHFAPRYMEEAISIYRKEFKPSHYLDSPHMTACLNVIAAESDKEAKRELTTLQQFFLNVVRGDQEPLVPPVDNMDELWSPQEKAAVSSMISVTFSGDKDSTRKQLTNFQEKYNVDEIMAVTYIYDQEKQKRSYEIFKDVAEGK